MLMITTKNIQRKFIIGNMVLIEAKDFLHKNKKTGMDRFQDCFKAKATNALQD